jgi:sugar lactone lactonase YvrE
MMATFANPTALAYDGKQTLYVTDSSGSAVRTVDTMNGAVGSVADSMLENASGIGLTATGLAIVTEAAQIDDIRIVTLADGGAPRFQATGGPGLGGPRGVAVTASGIFLADTYDNCLLQLDLDAGTAMVFAGIPGTSGQANETNAAATFGNPSAIASDGAGTLYVADTLNYSIRKIQGGATTAFTGGNGPGSANGIPGVAQFAQPQGMALDAAGNLFVADGATIREVDSSGNVTTVAGTAPATGTNDGPTGSDARFGQPDGVAVVGDYAYVVDTTNNSIRQVSIQTGATTTWAGGHGAGMTDGMGTNAQFNAPVGIASDPGGVYLYVLDGYGWLRRIDISSVEVDTIGRANYPIAIAADANNVYVAGLDQQVSSLPVNMLPADASARLPVVIAGRGGMGSSDGAGMNATFSSPSGLAVYGGTLFIADTGNAIVRALDLASTYVSTIAGKPGFANGNGLLSQFNRPTAITVDSMGNLFVVDGTSTIRKIDPTYNVTTFAGTPGHGIDQLGPLSTCSLNNPAGMAFTSQGALVITEPNEVSVLIIR